LRSLSLQRQLRRSIPLVITAEDLIQTPISINQNATIYDAVQKILYENISGVVIDCYGKFGILSQKDIAKILLEDNKSIKDILASQKMQELVLVDQFAPISNCASLMLSKKINTLGVKDSAGIKGIMTKHDLVRYYHENIVDERRLCDVMSIGSFFVPDTMTLYEALSKMLNNQVSRLLVKDYDDKPAGIVTYKSFLKNAIRNANKEDNVFATGFGRTVTIGEIMSKNLFSISLRTNLRKVAKVLIDYRVHGVAVTQNQKIIGFVTEKDIVRELANIC
jgi:predicted transcriptional regulator